jgi:hypothetical protein
VSLHPVFSSVQGLNTVSLKETRMNNVRDQGRARHRETRERQHGLAR